MYALLMWVGDFSAQDWRRIRMELQVRRKIWIGNDSLEW
jgi:hypothetical protein